MTAIYYYDDRRARSFEPFALTRPISEMVAGVGLIRDRWVVALQLPAAGSITSPHLTDFEEFTAPPAITNRVPRGSVIANSRFAPRLADSVLDLPRADLVSRAGDQSDASTHPNPVNRWVGAGRTVAVRIDRDVDVAELQDGRVELDALRSAQTRDDRTAELPGWWMDEIWDFIRLLPEQLADDIPYLYRGPLERGRLSGGPPRDATVLGESPVFVAPDLVVSGAAVRRGATVEPHVVLDARAGPIYIGPEAVIQAFSRIVGPCYIGAGAVIAGDRVAGSSIGDHCKVRGELSTTIMIGHSNKSHDGFVGHSYLGRWVNLGAGTITSNLKNTYGSVALWTPDGVRDTGLQFLGTLFGDHAKTGIGLRLTTGTVVGAGANLYGAAIPPKAVAPFAWGDRPPYATYRLDKFLEVAERVMRRRDVRLSDSARRSLAAAYDARWVAPGEDW